MSGIVQAVRPTSSSRKLNPLQRNNPRCRPMSNITKLIDEVSDRKNFSLPDVLLKAKVLAHSLKGKKFLTWVNWELDGYPVEVDVPAYRCIKVTLYGDYDGPFQSKCYNTPISVSHLGEPLSSDLLKIAVKYNVAMLESQATIDGTLGINMDGALVALLRQKGPFISGMVLNH